MEDPLGDIFNDNYGIIVDGIFIFYRGYPLKCLLFNEFV